MKNNKPKLKSLFSNLVCTAGCLLVASVSGAQEVSHLNITQPGGMPGLPVMTGITAGSNSVTVTWEGPSGYYRLFQALSLQGSPWQPVATNYNRRATLTGLTSNAFFKVQGPAPQYAGSFACAECHEGIHNNEMATRHTHALETLKAIGQGNNPSCLPCHTVGHGLPTGFITESATPHLAGVQCENCHGPAALHAANPDDITVRPRVELASQVCGGCHTGSHHPTFDEWSGSGHFAVTEDMNSSGRISNCGRCHSGSSRLALLKGENPAITVAGDANVGITCVVCHDPHANTANPAQLRNPVFSTNDYFLSTSDVFTNKYNPDINGCAQCHNHRGASWNGSTRAPHHSPQYNMLIGTVGERMDGSTNAQPSGHALTIANQCVGCHMQTREAGDDNSPAITGHSFRVQSYESCTPCHGPYPEIGIEFVMNFMSARIQQVKADLDQWALTKAPALGLNTNYGALAWEFNPPGGLSANTPGSTNTTQQALIPNNIKKARYNLYLVYHDGSYGVHNGPYAFKLLDDAAAWTQAELDTQP